MSERESLDVDILIVGGGPAGLSAAIRLAQLQKAAGKSLGVVGDLFEIVPKLTAAVKTAKG